MTISRTTPITHPKLPGVTVYPVSGSPKIGHQQQVLVIVEPGVQIPLHTHEVDAEMFIISGSAKVLSKDGTNGMEVTTGSKVFFVKEKHHGFEAGPNGFSFISTNGGIVDQAGWDIQF